jgi:diguanylate cyclase (GGDEF)-like protein
MMAEIAGLAPRPADAATAGRRTEDRFVPVLHAVRGPTSDVQDAAAPLEWKAYELRSWGEPRIRPLGQVAAETSGGTLLLDLGESHALLIAGSAVRRIPTGTDRTDLLRRAATGAAAWEKEQLRLWKRARLPDQLAELSAQLNRADSEEAIARHLIDYTTRIVGGYRSFVLLRDRSESSGLAAHTRFIDVTDRRISAGMHPRFTAPGITLAGEARADLGMPFSDLAPVFEETGAVVLIHVPIGDMGILMIAERRHSRIIEPEDFTLMRSLAQLGESALLRVFLVEEAHRLSLVDPLTGLANRRHLQVLMRHVWASARRGKRFTAVLVDIDNFKAVNDNHGHLHGDRMLREVADVLQEEVRGSDLVVRFGGDEFLIVLPDEGMDGASTLVRRIQARLSGTIEISAGAAEYHPAFATIDEMLEAADRQLYAMKRRNRMRTGQEY